MQMLPQLERRALHGRWPVIVAMTMLWYEELA